MNLELEELDLILEALEGYAGNILIPKHRVNETIDRCHTLFDKILKYGREKLKEQNELL